MKQRFICFLIIGFFFSLVFGCVAVNQNVPESEHHLQPVKATLADSLYLPPHKDFRIVVISDLNSQYGSTEYDPEVEQAIALMPQWQPDLVLCGGDMIAGQKTSLTKSQIESMWAAFEGHVAAPLREQDLPFGFTIGNHDASGAIRNQDYIFQQERKLATAYWHQQQHQLGLDFVDRANFPFYYSFQQNDLFFLVWDASTQNIAGEQLDWVTQALNSPAAQQATTKIVIGHLPLYPVAKAKNKPGEYLADGRKLRSLLEQNQVFLYISGHQHAYYPGKMEGLELLHAGALGQGARQLINSDLPPNKTVTVVDLELATSQLIYTTYDAQTWKLTSLEQLPTSIPSDDGEIWRQDQ
ncbi:MAG: metallophosphoesterase [Waterburya sp.]